MNRAERRRRQKQAALTVRRRGHRDAGRAEALFAQANALDDAGCLEAAVRCFRDALAGCPDYAEAHNNLGIVLRKLGRPEDAVASYRAALAINPGYARAHNNLANALLDLGRPDEAIAGFRAAIAADPDYVRAHCNLGHALIGIERPDEAVACYRAALALDPALPEAHTSLAAALAVLGRAEEAADSCRAALALDPENPDAHNNLGLAVRKLGRLDEAIGCYRQALAVAPGHPGARQNLCNALLATGCLDEGWARYDGLLGQAGGRRPLRRFRAPAWHGEPVASRRVLVWPEQGIGDEILFAGIYGDMIERCGSCVIEASPRLRPIIARSFSAAEVRDAPDSSDYRAHEDFDLQVAAGSLARHLRPVVAAFPSHRGYLVPDAERVGRWRQRLDALGASRVIGVSWTSGKATPSRRRESFYTDLADWRPIFAVPGCAFVTLQYGDHEAEIRAVEATGEVRLHRWADLDLRDDLESVFALVSCLDGVISARNAVVDIAGSLGVPTFTSTERGNFQVLGTDGLPWHPSVRVFFRRIGEPHAARLERMAAALADLPPRVGGRVRTLS